MKILSFASWCLMHPSPLPQYYLIASEFRVLPSKEFNASIKLGTEIHQLLSGYNTTTLFNKVTNSKLEPDGKFQKPPLKYYFNTMKEGI